MPSSADSNLENDNLSSPSTAVKRRRREDMLYSFIVLLLFGLFAFQLWFHATRTSVTIDEPVHILAGHRYLQCGDFGVNTEHPPLLKLLAASPLIGRTFIEPYEECGSKINYRSEETRSGMLFLSKNGIDSIVVPTRLAASLMSLLLAVLVFLATREMFGRWASVVALGLLAFEPNLIAHGSVVTTDMALTTMMFAAVYALYRYLKKPGVFRFLVVGLAVGLTLSAKHSGILILPILFLTLIADIFITRQTDNKTRLSAELFRRAAAFAGIVFIGVIVLWSCYGLRFNALPNTPGNSIPIENFQWYEDSLAQRVVLKLNRFRILPESYNDGMGWVLGTGSRRMFLFNESYPTGRWFYFPVAFAIKTSVALLILLLASLLTLELYRRRRREMLFLLMPSLAFFVVSMTSQMNIGVRHILPVYPFFIVIAAGGACFWARKYRIVSYALIALLVFHAAFAVRTAPNYLAFSNVFFGGVDNTYKVLADSNVEWGQSVKLANEYLARENITDCWFAGNDNIEINLLEQPCRLLPGTGSSWFTPEQLIEPAPPVIEGTILLSAWVLPPMSSAILPRGNEYLPVTQSEPIAIIGGSILVYRGRFEVPLVAALSHYARARQLIDMKRFEEAVADGAKAVELAPDDPNAHYVLGLALARSGRRDEARREFETSIRLAAVNPPMFRRAEMDSQGELRQLQ
jgi:4-amino-4-deoxy-L-arabinose transferase-like glycosyltransferase